MTSADAPLDRQPADGTPAAAVVVAPLLDALIATVRATAQRVVASAAPARRARSDSQAPPSDDEAVHDFRVAIRRLRSVLRVVRPVYGRARTRMLGLRLKRFADATGALRDEEVLRETLLGLSLGDAVRAELEAWLGRRARQERGRRIGVAQLLAREADAELAEVLAAVEKLVAKGAERAGRGKRERDRDVTIAELARRALDRAVGHAFGEALPDARDGAAMHALRIRFKRLRYASELLSEALATVVGAGAVTAREASAAGGSGTVELADRAAKLAKVAAKLQKRLGELHDLDVALLRIGRAWGLSLDTRGVVAAALREARDRCAARTIGDLQAAREAFSPPVLPAGPL